MMNKPTTLEQARLGHYGHSHGQMPNFIEGRCAEEVSQNEGRWTSFHQCTRKSGHGPEGLYCKLHAEPFGAQEAKGERWYRLSQREYSAFEVVPVEAVRTSEKYIWLKEAQFNYANPEKKTFSLNKEYRNGGYHRYVQTLEEVRVILTERIISQRRAMEAAEKEFAEAIAKVEAAMGESSTTPSTEDGT